MLGSISGLATAFIVDYFYTSRREHQRRWGGKREAEYQRALMDEMDLGEEEEESDDDERRRQHNVLV